MSETPTATNAEPVDVASVQKPKLTADELFAQLLDLGLDPRAKADVEKARTKEANKKLTEDRERYQNGITDILAEKAEEILEFLPKGIVFEISRQVVEGEEDSIFVAYKTRRGQQSFKGTGKRGTRAFRYTNGQGAEIVLTATSWNKLARQVADLLSDEEKVRFPNFARNPWPTAGVKYELELGKLLTAGVFEGSIDAAYVEAATPETPEVE